LFTIGNDLLDSSEAVQRALFETWFLTLEFRLGSESRINDWYANKNEAWKAHKGTVQRGLKEAGLADILLGREIFDLAKLAHPTQPAAQNSFVLTAAHLGNPEMEQNVLAARVKSETREIPILIHRHLWASLQENPRLLHIGIDRSAIPHAIEFMDRYEDLTKATR
jgi:hypothetical protein